VPPARRHRTPLASIKTEAALLDSLVRIAVRSRDSSTAARRSPRHTQAI